MSKKKGGGPKHKTAVIKKSRKPGSRGPLKHIFYRAIKKSEGPVEEYIMWRVPLTEGGGVNFRTDERGRLVCDRADASFTKSIRSYMRESGKLKVVCESNLNSTAGHFLYNRNLLDRYDVLASVDTNSYNHQGRKLSITASCCTKAEIGRDPSAVETEVELTSSVIFVDVVPDVNPEVLGWYYFINTILPGLELREDAKIGIVVDSELDKHQAINSREAPYYRDVYLPRDIELLYASADTGSEACNQLIKFCDKKSKELFTMIKTGLVSFPDQLGTGDDFGGVVIVNYKKEV